MKLIQISVFLENRKGRLAEVCSLLSDAGVSIRALNVADTEAFGVLRIVVDKPEEAIDLFHANNITASKTEVVAVEVPDTPGGLSQVLTVLSGHDVNIEYMYGFVEKSVDKALLVFRFDDVEQAIKVLADAGVNVLKDKDIMGL